MNLRAGDGDRTRDVQLGKLDVSSVTQKLLIENQKRLYCWGFRPFLRVAVWDAICVDLVGAHTYEFRGEFTKGVTTNLHEVSQEAILGDSLNLGARIQANVFQAVEDRGRLAQPPQQRFELDQRLLH